jgi:hypothetical protein
MKRKAAAEEKRRVKALRKSLLQNTVNELQDARTQNDGKLPHGRMAQAVNSLKAAGLAVSRDVLNRMKPTISPGLPVRVSEDDAATTVSDLSGNSTRPTSTTTPHRAPHQSSPSNMTTTTTTTKTLGGRPKGSTAQSKRDAVDRKVSCINKITELYVEKKADGPLPSYYLKTIISEQMKCFDVKDRIAPETIRSRGKRGIVAPETRGPRLDEFSNRR